MQQGSSAREETDSLGSQPGAEPRTKATRTVLAVLNHPAHCLHLQYHRREAAGAGSAVHDLTCRLLADHHCRARYCGDHQLTTMAQATTRQAPYPLLRLPEPFQTPSQPAHPRLATATAGYRATDTAMMPQAGPGAVQRVQIASADRQATRVLAQRLAGLAEQLKLLLQVRKPRTASQCNRCRAVRSAWDWALL